MSGHHSRLHWCRQAHCRKSQLNPRLADWLFDHGSLTARLIEFCKGEFAVELLSFEKSTPTPDEMSALGMKPRQQAMVRQVLLKCGGQPVVYARTIIPLSSLRSQLRGLVNLGNRPLGAVLFSDKKMRRGPVEVTSIDADHPCHAWTQYKGVETIFGRRSIFLLKQQPLLVSEFFFPNLYR